MSTGGSHAPPNSRNGSQRTIAMCFSFFKYAAGPHPRGLCLRAFQALGVGCCVYLLSATVLAVLPATGHHLPPGYASTTSASITSPSFTFAPPAFGVPAPACGAFCLYI